ncbi:MAG TPA: sigma-70 family RNA polymerase sigma factor [Candidatus Eisenbacteria bacterium]|nr:sigma-70 family RNA polymerase sigma factor [Candidatus Eisenbacteria bacterium]
MDALLGGIERMNQPDRDRSALERMVAGDTRALEELYDRHGDLLYSLVRRVLSRAEDAEDVIQEIWLQAWRGARTYDPKRGTVCGWLVSIARSRAIDRLRSEGSRKRATDAAGVDSPDPPESPAESAVDRQRREHVDHAMSQLDPQHREVLQLAYFAGLSQSEISERLGAPLGTVKSWTRQALSRLEKLVPREEWL